MERTTNLAEADVCFPSRQGSDPLGCYGDTAYVHPINFLALGSRDMHDANNKAVDYLFHALFQSEFDRVQKEDLACKIWEQLKNAHAGNNQVQAQLFVTWAQLFVTYRREYENFTLPLEQQR
jgi:hypothetical protein